MKKRKDEENSGVSAENSGSGATVQNGGAAAGESGLAVGGNVHGDIYMPGSLPASCPSPSLLPALPNLFIGRDNDMDALRQLLFGEAATTLMTAVRGWPGIGKTTLAATLAHDAEVKEAFPDGVLWTALGMSPNPFAGLGEWLRAFGDDPQHYQRIEERQNRLAGMLRDRRMLLIIDDVWQAADAQPFLMGGHSCRTLITTREPDVARKLGLPDKAIYRLLVLAEEDSIELIRQLSPDSVAQDYQGVQRLVQELEGLPLALKIAGSLLAAEAPMGWGVKDLLEELAEGTRLLEEHPPADYAETSLTVAALLQKSTDRLDVLSRKQFAFLGVFAPKPATFDLSAIAAAWGVEDSRPAIRELERRGLLEPYKEDGEVRFQMHALLTVHAKAMWENRSNV